MKLLKHYKLMLTMRHFEEACLEGVPTGEIHGELHTGIGQEAMALAVSKRVSVLSTVSIPAWLKAPV